MLLETISFCDFFLYNQFWEVSLKIPLLTFSTINLRKNWHYTIFLTNDEQILILSTQKTLNKPPFKMQRIDKNNNGGYSSYPILDILKCQHKLKINANKLRHLREEINPSHNLHISQLEFIF